MEAEPRAAIWDPKKYGGHQAQDVERHNQNVRDGKKLCPTCCGTGNEFFSMFHQCPDCNGTGIVAEDKDTPPLTLPSTPSEAQTMLDLMSKEELRQQLDTQTSIIVDIDNRSARLEHILRMALNLKNRYRHDVMAGNKLIKELQERLEVRDALVEELMEVLQMREGLEREKKLGTLSEEWTEKKGGNV